jgi:hypothetical protein
MCRWKKKLRANYSSDNSKWIQKLKEKLRKEGRGKKIFFITLTRNEVNIEIWGKLSSLL